MVADRQVVQDLIILKERDAVPLIVKGRHVYKPFSYPELFELAIKHEKMHWLPTEVSLNEDVVDWKDKLTDDERNLLTQLFRFFTQADVGVLQGYAGKLLPLFWRTPEAAAVLSSIAAREMVHTWAYSLLLETIGMDVVEYQAFLEYEEMADKDAYVTSFNCDTPENIAKTLAVYGAFTEGLQLFSSFAILMNFARFNKMKGMGKIVEWSIRDEDVHVETCITLYKIWMNENPQLDKTKMEQDLRDICLRMVELEDAFIDLAFGVSEIQGLDKEDVKQYVRSIANFRLQQLGLEDWELFPNTTNPLAEWLDPLIYGSRHTNFFENRVTDYARGAIEFDDNEEMEY